MSENKRSGPLARPRRWWLALILNLLMPPAGYAYVGAWRFVIGLVGLLLVGGIALHAWTFSSPPGIYGWSNETPVLLGAVVAILLAAHAAWLSRRARPFAGPVWQRWAIYLAVGLAPYLVSAGMRSFFPQSIYAVASASMEPALQEGDTFGVWGARAVCGWVRPRHGDIVVYRSVDRPSVSYVHRVVAGPGQTVAMTAGRLIVDGTPVHASQRGSAGPAAIVREVLGNGVGYDTLDLGPDAELDAFPARRLGADQWFVLGDNRDNALDSRFVGPIMTKDICGVVVRVLQSKEGGRVGSKP